MLEQRIQQQFFDAADLQYASAEVLAKPIADAVSALVGSITAGGKVLVCGSGATGASAEHFAAVLIGRFERERPGLAAIALSANPSVVNALGSEHGVAAVFSKQVQALGSPGDVLLVLTTDAAAADVLAAIEAARAKEMVVIALAGHQPTRLRERLQETDVLIAIPHERAARVHELHLLTLHCLCDAVDLQLLGEPENT